MIRVVGDEAGRGRRLDHADHPKSRRRRIWGGQRPLRWTSTLVLIALASPAGAQSAPPPPGGCIYPPPDDPEGLVTAVAALATELGAPGRPEVDISFDRDTATVSVAAGRSAITVRWRAGERCGPPFERLSEVPEEAPGWAAHLHRVLPERFGHSPRSSGTEAWQLRPLPPVWSVAVPWIAWLLALLAWWSRAPRPPPATQPLGRPAVAVAVALVAGVVVLAVRWSIGLTTEDELDYLRSPGRDPAQLASLRFYLNDAGLPSLVHRALVLLLYPLGGRDALSVAHAVLYLVYGVGVHRLAQQLLPNALAAAVAVACLLHPLVLLYFGEHRSYASFLTLAAFGALAMLRYVRSGDRRQALWMTGLLGLAALDNPLCVVLPAAFAVTAAVVPAWRRQLHPARLALSAALLALAVAPSAVTASLVPRFEAGGSIARWLISSAFVVGPPLLLGLGPARLRPLRWTLGLTWALITAPMVLGRLPFSPGKIELFALPLLVAASVAALRLERVPSLLRWGTLALYLAGYALGLKLPAQAAELNTPARARSVRAVDDALHERAMEHRITVYWAREFKRTEYASVLTEIDPFTANPQALSGLSGHYRFVEGGWPRERCGAGEPFFVVVAPFAPAPECGTCRLAIASKGEWHAFECQ